MRKFSAEKKKKQVLGMELEIFDGSKYLLYS